MLGPARPFPEGPGGMLLISNACARQRVPIRLRNRPGKEPPPVPIAGVPNCRTIGVDLNYCEYAKPQVHNMLPILVKIGPITLYTYGMLVAFGFLCALALAIYLAPRFGFPKIFVWDWAFYVLIGVIVGSRLLYFIVEWRYIEWTPKGILLTFLHAGGVFYGGLIGAAALSIWYLRRVQAPLWDAADLAAAPLALGHAIGRIGCFAAGCCYGKPTDVPWAVEFTHPFSGEKIGTPLMTPLHPTQLYESAWNLVIFVTIFVLIRWRRRSGDLWWIYLPMYGVGRFVIEFFRGDPRGSFWGLSTSQWIALLAVLLSLVWWGYWRARTATPVLSMQPTSRSAETHPG